MLHTLKLNLDLIQTENIICIKHHIYFNTPSPFTILRPQVQCSLNSVQVPYSFPGGYGIKRTTEKNRLKKKIQLYKIIQLEKVLDGLMGSVAQC